MRKRVVSWILIVTLIFTQNGVMPTFVNATTNGQVTNETPEFNSGGASNWNGSYPKTGDSIFYVEVKGRNLDKLSADVATFGDDKSYTAVASQTERWYLGKTFTGEERYIYEMTMDGNKTLTNRAYYVRLKDSNYTYYDNNSAYFHCSGINIFVDVNHMPDEISEITTSFPFHINTFGANGNVDKNNLSIKLYSGTKENFRSEVIVKNLVGNVQDDDYEIIVTGDGNYSLKGVFTVTNPPIAGDTLYVEVDYSGNKAYTNTPVYVISQTGLGQFKLTNAFAGRSTEGHHESMGTGYEGIDNATFYIGSTTTSTAHKFTLTGGNLSDKSLITVTDNNGTNIMRSGTINIKGPANDIYTATGMIDIPSSATSILINYNGNTVHTVLVERTPKQGGISLTPVGYEMKNGEYVLPQDTTDFQVALSGVNLPASSTSYSAILSGNVISCNVESSDGQLVFNLSSTEPLDNSLYLELMLDGEKLSKLLYDEGAGITTDTYTTISTNITFGEIYYTLDGVVEPPSLTRISGNRQLTLYGEGFDSSKSYTAYFMEHSKSGLSATPQEFSATYVSSKKLNVSESLTDSLARGWYEVYLKEDGTQINGFYKAVLLPAEDIVTIINPTIIINDNKPYTTINQITMNMTSGSFTHVRFSENQASLSSMPYNAITNSVNYTLSDGYGIKNIYFEFKNAEGNTYNKTASINYRSTVIPAPSICGVMGITNEESIILNKFADYNLYIQEQGVGNIGKVELIDAYDSILDTYELKRTSGTENLYTYSKLVNFSNSDIKKLRFYLIDSLGLISEYTEISVNVVEVPYITYYHSDIKSNFLGNKRYVESESYINYTLKGKLSYDGIATLKYKDAENVEKTAEVILSENNAGIYTGSESIPADAAEIVSIEYKIVDPDFSSNYVTKTEEKLFPVSVNATFSGLPNTGDFDGKYLRFSYNNTRIQSKKIEGDKTNFTFNNILPGSYEYSIYDTYNTYKKGQFEAVSGVGLSVNLSDTLKPATITFNISGGTLSEGAYIKYSYKINDNLQYGYAIPNEPKTGFYQGMIIEGYELILPYCDLKVYTVPEAVTTPVTLSGGANSQNVIISTLSTVNLKITANDSNIAGRVVPETRVYINQLVENGSTSFYYNTSGITDDHGQVTLTLYPNIDVNIYADKDNYKNSSFSYKVTDDVSQEYEISLTYADQNRIKINSYSRPLLGSDEEYDNTQLFESNESISYLRVTDTDDKLLNIYNTSSSVTFKSDMKNQTVRIYPAMYYGFVNETEFYTVELDEYGNGMVDIVAIPKGIITADIAMKGDNLPASYMLIYNSNGDIVDIIIDAGGRMSSETCKLNEGNYTVVIFSGYDLTNLNGLSDIDMLGPYGFVENVHYAKKSVTVENGKTKYLGEINLPSLITKDMLVPYSVNFDTKFVPTSLDGLSGKIYVKAKIVVSELLKNNFSLKSIAASNDYNYFTYDKAVNGVISNFGSQNYTPDSEGNYTITFTADTISNRLKSASYLSLSFNQNGVEKQARFYTVTDTPKVSIIVPKQVMKDIPDITVQGIAFAGSTVDIYDGETLICSTEANQSHSYKAVISLLALQRNEDHIFKAKMTTSTGEIYTSTDAPCKVIDGDMRATISNYQFSNVAHYGTLENPSVKKYNVGNLGNTPGGSYIYYPNGLSRVSFRINKLVSSQLENVYVINTDTKGIKTKYRAELVEDDPNGKYSDWKMEAILGNSINNISVFYSLKYGEDMGILTGYHSPTEQQFAASLNNIDKIDPASIPQSFRDPNAAIITEQTANSLKAHKNFGNGKVGIEVNYTSVSGYSEQQLIAQGFRKIPVGNQGEYYLIKDSSTTSGNDFRANRTMYLSEGLAATLNNGSLMSMSIENPESLVDAQLETILASNSQVSILKDNSQPNIYASSANVDTARNISGKVDYVGYIQNTGEIGYEAFRNRTADLGKLGGGMQIIGGAATAVQIFSGPASIDPANLKALASKIKDSNVRSRLNDEIWEYQCARRDSHSISSLMSVVSYGSSFFLLPGKCLSYVVSTGNMVYTQKIDAEYNLWGNSIIAQIAMQLRKEEQDIGEEDDPEDPKWLMDPSGYVFEAIDSQRIEGISATAQTDESGSWSAWNDEALIESEQKNPQITDKNGKYGWDVPMGNWRVLFEDDTNKYRTALSKSMTVPPAHTEVNIGLLSLEVPKVLSATVDASSLEIEFSKYMQAESIYDAENKIINVQVFETVGGQNVPCEGIDFIESALNTSYGPDGIYQEDIISSSTFVKRIRFNADTSLYPSGYKMFEDDGVTPKKYSVIVSANVLSYSGIPMESDYTEDIEVAERKTVVEPTANTVGGSYKESQTVSLNTITDGATIYYTTNGKTPNTTSTKYNAPISIFESCVLKAIASKVGMDDSTIFSATYMIGETTHNETIPDEDDKNDGNSEKPTTAIEPQKPQVTIFKDVATNDWFYDSVNYVVEKGLFKGISDDEFAPNSNMTRSMIVTVLYRLAGSPSINGTSFKDVESESWYEDAVMWASQNNIVEGYGNGIFGSVDNITREQMAVVLYRYAKYMGYDVSATTDIEIFTDADKISSWAITPIKWMVANGLLNGKLNNVLDSKGNATRSEIATILYRFLKNIIK